MTQGYGAQETAVASSLVTAYHDTRCDEPIPSPLWTCMGVAACMLTLLEAVQTNLHGETRSSFKEGARGGGQRTLHGWNTPSNARLETRELYWT